VAVLDVIDDNLGLQNFGCENSSRSREALDREMSSDAEYRDRRHDWKGNPAN
jgi:hypothetical protein